MEKRKNFSFMSFTFPHNGDHRHIFVELEMVLSEILNGGILDFWNSTGTV